MVGKSVSAQTWVDSVDKHGREVFMPAAKYKWDWGQATFLNSLVHLYNSKSADEKKIYLDYIKTAMDTTYAVANGKHPNAMASAHGMAFLARITGDKKYLDKSNSIYQDFLQIPRAANGGVSHRAETVELWDDTIYMLSMYLLEMFRLTGDEKYIADFMLQFNSHKKELTDDKTGLWVHGWDADNVDYNDGCSVMGWPDKTTRKSSQIWARGNGWIGMALADALLTIPKSSKYKKLLEKELKLYIEKVAPYQNQTTGLWYQLLSLPEDPLNWQESSSTVMFSYAITIAIQLKVVDKKKYLPIVEKAYQGIKTTSLKNAQGGYLIPARICGGTCIGDKAYYLNRKVVEGTGFGYGSFIMFGLAYEQLKGIRP
jgi:unsaturated rhamnogalacturonyl hydrolase